MGDAGRQSPIGQRGAPGRPCLPQRPLWREQRASLHPGCGPPCSLELRQTSAGHFLGLTDKRPGKQTSRALHAHWPAGRCGGEWDAALPRFNQRVHEGPRCVLLPGRSSVLIFVVAVQVFTHF